ncbi:MAG: hypothetical protein JWM07_277 [Candidatus Saccharibacteria bacterium]|nr:hypothetical protein [Candidatus Saccharibacteria bacterium]
MAKGPNNKSDVLLPAEEQLRIKRAKKASQNADARANAHSGNRPVLNHQKPQPIRWQTPLLGAVRDPKIVERERVAAETKKKREAEAVSFRIKQAQWALESTNVTTLAADSVARKIAEKTIHFFPTVAVDTATTGRTRLAEAIFQARAELSFTDVRFDKAVKLGADRARFALNRAHDMHKNELVTSGNR